MKTISESQAKRKFGALRLNMVGDGEAGEEQEIQCADHRENVGEVLACVDRQLQLLGFQIVQHDTGDDSYRWHIESIKTGKGQ